MPKPKSGTACIENFINGNLTDAKRMAENVSHDALINRAREYGYKYPEAVMRYLKGQLSYQKCCDLNGPDREVNHNNGAKYE